MSESLSQSQLEELRERLLELARELEGLLSSADEQTRPVDLGLPIGRLTRMDAIQQQQMAQAGRRSVERRLLQVKAALAAWQRGEYGDCQSCGAEISYARLEARPESPMCLDCQSASEAEPAS